jgi:hypothetical protein
MNSFPMLARPSVVRSMLSGFNNDNIRDTMRITTSIEFLLRRECEGHWFIPKRSFL